MFRRTVVALLLLLVVMSVAGQVSAQPNTSTTVSVSIDGRHLEPGERVIGPGGPTLDIEVRANATIESIIVRSRAIGHDNASDRVAVFYPDARTANRSLRLDLLEAPNRVRVIVRTTANETVSTRFTYVKDSRPPIVEYSGAFAGGGVQNTSNSNKTTTIQYPGTVAENQTATRVQIGQSLVFVSGEARDTSNLSSVKIETVYNYSYAQELHGRRVQHRLGPESFTDVDGDGRLEFSKEIYFPVDGFMRVTTTDETGNLGDDFFFVDVRDRLRPAIDITPILGPDARIIDRGTDGNASGGNATGDGGTAATPDAVVTTPKVRFTGRISDNHQLMEVDSLHTVELRVANATTNTSGQSGSNEDDDENRNVTNLTVRRNPVLHRSAGLRASLEYRTIDFDQTYRLLPGNNTINITAEDLYNNTAEYNYTILYDVPSPTPRIRLRRSDVLFDPDGRIEVNGSVTDGNVTDVLVEVRRPRTGEILDQETIYSGRATTDRIPVNATLSTELPRVRVVIRAIDVAEQPHERGVVVERGATPTETPTPTLTPTPTPMDTPIETPTPSPTSTATSTAATDTSSPTATGTAASTPVTGIAGDVTSLAGPSVGVIGSLLAIVLSLLLLSRRR